MSDEDQGRFEGSKIWPVASTILIMLLAVGAAGYIIAKHFQ